MGWVAALDEQSSGASFPREFFSIFALFMNTISGLEKVKVSVRSKLFCVFFFNPAHLFLFMPSSGKGIRLQIRDN